MSEFSTPSADAVDEYLDILAHKQCRFVLYYFARHSTEVATIDDLAAFIREQTQQDGDTTQITSRLYHSTLPRLADVGVVEYDAQSNTVRYREHPPLEMWVNHVVEQGEAPVIPV